MKLTKIYVLTAYTNDGRIIDLDFSEDLKLVRNEINSPTTIQQLKDLKVKEVKKVAIRDNRFPSKFYPLKVGD